MPFVPIAASCHSPPGVRPMRSAPRRSHSGVDCQRTRPSASATRAIRSPVVASWSSWPARPGTARRIVRLVPAAPGHRRLLDGRGVHIALDDRCAAPPGRGHDRIDGAADVPGIRRTCLLDRFPSLEEIVLHRHPRLYAPARGVTGSVRRFDSARVFADRSSQPTFVQPRWGDALGWRRASACRPPPGAHGSAGSGAGPPARLPLPALQDRPPGGSGRRDRTPVRPTSPRQASPAPDALRSARDPEPG